MAEGWARVLAAGLPPGFRVSVESAGLEAHGLNPRAVRTMARHGVDISAQPSTELHQGLLERADLLVSVCSHADIHCPVLPPGMRKKHLPFEDPAAATGSDREIDAVFERVCLQIRDAVAALLREWVLDGLQEARGDVYTQADVQVSSRSTDRQGFIPVDVIHLRHRLFAGGWSDQIRRELAVRNPAVGVLLYDPDRDAVVMVRQFRTGALAGAQSPWLLEIVAGIAADGETAAEVVRREALEEANCRITDLLPVHDYFSSPGWTNEKASIFCARVDAGQTGGVHGLDEEHEDILVVTLPFDEAVAALHAGSINNAMSIIALQWLQLNRESVRSGWRKRP